MTLGLPQIEVAGAHYRPYFDDPAVDRLTPICRVRRRLPRDSQHAIGCGKARSTAGSLVAGISDGRTRRIGLSLCIVEQNQFLKSREHPVVRGVMITPRHVKGCRRKIPAIELKHSPICLLTIHPSRVASNNAEKFGLYQVEAGMPCTPTSPITSPLDR